MTNCSHSVTLTAHDPFMLFCKQPIDWAGLVDAHTTSTRFNTNWFCWERRARGWNTLCEWSLRKHEHRWWCAGNSRKCIFIFCINFGLYVVLFETKSKLCPIWKFSVQASVRVDSAAQAALTEHFSGPLSPFLLSGPPLLTFVGPGLLWVFDPCGQGAAKKWGGGLFRGGNSEAWWRAYVLAWWWTECWLASADATQASAVSSQQLIPPSRSPLGSRGSLQQPRGWKLRPPCATSSLWHNSHTRPHTHDAHCQIISLWTNVSSCKPESIGATHRP